MLNLEYVENKLIHVYVVDGDGFVIGTEIVEDNETLANNMVKLFAPSNLYKPKWNGIKWVEGETQQETEERESQILLNSLQPSPQDLADADFEIKVLTLLMEMEVI